MDMAYSLLTPPPAVALKALDDSTPTNPGSSDDRGSQKTATDCPILIVEDDADLREMMAQLLTLEGFRAAAVANGREALKYLGGTDAPQVILLDLMMPVMDGWEFRRHQQADPNLADVPVIVLSALDQARAADLDAAAFLKKPLDFDRLLELVRHYCE
jgi:two-component system, chemotaxis family, chemotaxis protein CheY